MSCILRKHLSNDAMLDIITLMSSDLHLPKPLFVSLSEAYTPPLQMSSYTRSNKMDEIEERVNDLELIMCMDCISDVFYCFRNMKNFC